MSGRTPPAPADNASDEEAAAPAAAEPFIDCPKCHAHNPPARVACLTCGGRLLRGRTAGERIILLIVGVVGAAGLAALAYFLAQRISQGAAINPLGPVYLGVASIFALFMGIGLAVGRTPRYEQYIKRADRHQSISPLQSLADLTTALELAPKKQQADIYRRRSDLYAKMGRRLDALADLAAYSRSEGAHAGTKAASEATGLPVDSFAEGWTQGKISGMQQALVRDGQLHAIGYCRHCKDVTALGDRSKRCATCGHKLNDMRYVRPQELDTAASQLRADRARRQRGRWITFAIALVGIIAAVLICNYAGLFEPRTSSAPSPTAVATSGRATAAAPGSATFVRFEEDVFSFEYPSDWERITEDDVPLLLAGTLEGMRRDQARYIGGVYTVGLDDCPDCASIVLVVLEEDAIEGTFTEEQYQAVRGAAERQMGSRLLSHRFVVVGGLPGAESIHIGASQLTKLWDLIVVPPDPGLAYSISCSTVKEEYDRFQPIFARAFETLRFAGVEVVEEEPSQVEETPRTPEGTDTPALDVRDCRLGATFQADLSIPDGTRIAAADEFTKTWRVRNTGSCPWGPGYRLTFVDGDQMGGADWVPVPETEAGRDAQMSVDLIAPRQAGRYRGAWQVCVTGGNCFGDRLTIVIEVTE